MHSLTSDLCPFSPSLSDIAVHQQLLVRNDEDCCAAADVTLAETCFLPVIAHVAPSHGLEVGIRGCETAATAS